MVKMLIGFHERRAVEYYIMICIRVTSDTAWPFGTRVRSITVNIGLSGPRKLLNKNVRRWRNDEEKKKIKITTGTRECNAMIVFALTTERTATIPKAVTFIILVLVLPQFFIFFFYSCYASNVQFPRETGRVRLRKKHNLYGLTRIRPLRNANSVSFTLISSSIVTDKYNAVESNTSSTTGFHGPIDSFPPPSVIGNDIKFKPFFKSFFELLKSKKKKKNAF